MLDIKKKTAALGHRLVSELELLSRELNHVHSQSSASLDSVFQCAQNGNAKEVARIIESDPSRLQAKNPQGQTPLHVAASKGHLSVVEVMVGERIGKSVSVFLVLITSC